MKLEKQKDRKSSIISRLSSPVLWISVVGLIYSAVLVPSIPELPDWTAIVGFLSAIFGIANNPTDKNSF